jgi:hypothetical protein
MRCASLLETVTEKAATPVLLAPTKRRRTLKYVCLGYIEPGKFEGVTEDERNAVFGGIRKTGRRRPLCSPPAAGRGRGVFSSLMDLKHSLWS